MCASNSSREKQELRARESHQVAEELGGAALPTTPIEKWVSVDAG